MRTIAEREDISRKYLHALLTSLKAAGLVRSVRGSGGGYVLARPPRDIRLNEVVQVLEGSLTLADCVKDRRVCERADSCIGMELWRDMSHALENLLGGITLQDLMVRQSARPIEADMYYI